MVNSRETIKKFFLKKYNSFAKKGEKMEVYRMLN